MRASRSAAPRSAAHRTSARLATRVATGAWLLLATVAFVQVYLAAEELRGRVRVWEEVGDPTR